MRPGSVVVFEGLDKAGKSTQLSRLMEHPWQGRKPVFAHLPSGLTALTEAVYALTEQKPITSALARQLLHLACHAENMPALVEGRDRSGLVLDRWWWSTMAYGWYAHGEALGMGASGFKDLIDSVWSPLTADAVFLFTTPFQQDDLNRDGVLRGYQALAQADVERTVMVPAHNPDVIAAFILDELVSRDLVVGA